MISKPTLQSSDFMFLATEENYRRLDKLPQPQRGNIKAMYRDAVSQYANARATDNNPALEVRAACLRLETVMKAAAKYGVKFTDIREETRMNTLQGLCPREAAKAAYDMLRGNPDNLPLVKQALSAQGFVLDEKRLAGLESNLIAYRDSFLKAVRKVDAREAPQRGHTDKTR